MLRRTLLLYVCAASACGGGVGVPGDGGVDAGEALICPRLVSWKLLFPRCYGHPELCPAAVAGVDDDEDGASEAAGDCNDADPFVGPAAEETCDLRDNNCDGQVDEGGACEDPAEACPLTFADVRCCGATDTIAGSFYDPASQNSQTNPAPDGTWSSPFEVVLRRRSTGELRRAITCPDPPRTDLGYPYRFYLHDASFVAPGEDYDLVIHLRWYFPAILDPDACLSLAPVITTDAASGAACIDYGAFTLPCL